MLTTNQNLQQERYRIVGQLGQTDAGASYEAFDNTLGTNVLLKEIRDNLGKVTTPAQLEARKMSFAKRARTLTEMKHESLLAVKDFFSEIDHHYLVTEFTGGNTLGELFEKNKNPFPLADVSNWADSLLDALNYLHTLTPPVIHGEVKPQNITLSADGKVKLLVFNLVKSADEINAAASRTFDAAVLPYLPLEQIWQGLDAASKKVILTNYDDKSERVLEQPADARSDVFTLAATIYHLLTARIPADALTRSIDILEGKADPLQSPTLINPSVPKEISEVLMKALEIKRENRFSSAVIMRQVLRTAFARVKERESNAAKSARMEDDAVLEIPVVEPKPIVTAPAPAAPKNLEMESEQARQLELIKQQLRETEARRLEAEQRAVEAEKRLLEAEKEVEKPVLVEYAQEFASLAPAAVPAEPKNFTSADEYSSDEYSGMFAEPPKEGGAFKKVAAAAVALVVLGGAGFGIFTVMQSKSTEQMPTISTVNAAIPAPTAENNPAPPTETAPETNEQATTETTQPADSTSTEAVNPAAFKPKPAIATPTPQTAQVKKPASTPAKTAETQKKVTLDDLLKDN